MGILDDLKTENYRLGDYQAVRYDRNSPLFGETFMPDLYFALGAGRRTAFRRENLQMLFCGMSDLSLPGIISYLNQQKLCVLGKWEGQVFRTGGVCWVNYTVGIKEKSAFGAYGFLRWTWGTEEQEIFGWLGLAMLFDGLDQIHGQRYQKNHLTAKFMQKFGFQDYGCVPKLIPWGERLESGVVSSLNREDFCRLLSEKVIEASV
jgi:hypothetical protein